MARVFQYHASVLPFDAIGNTIHTLHAFLQRRGLESYILCREENLSPDRPQVRSVRAVLDADVRTGLTPEDVLIVHYSFADEVAVRLALAPVRKILVYHNITPGRFFRGVAGMEWLAHACEHARSELRSLSKLFDLALGVSAFNTAELTAAGFSRTATLPIFVNTDFYGSPDLDAHEYMAVKAGAGSNIVFVGRFVPNKNIEGLIDLLHVYRKAFDSSAALHLVGKVWDEGYFNSLLERASALGVGGGLKLHLQTESTKLKALFAAADAFVSLSEHEGFMVPLVEAFAAGCPVVAYRAAAVGDTLGGGGLGIDEPDPMLAAGLVHALKTDRELRAQVVQAGARRAFDFRREATERRWWDVLTGLSAAA